MNIYTYHTYIIHAKEEWIGCFLDDLRSFGIDVDQWTTAAQDEGEWHKTAEQGAESFIAKWIAAEKEDWTADCSSLPERDDDDDGKDQGQESPKQACSYWFARRHG